MSFGCFFSLAHRVSVEDEAIDQFKAENSMGSRQASAQKAMIGNPEPCPTPRDLQGMALSISASVLRAAPLVDMASASWVRKVGHKGVRTWLYWQCQSLGPSYLSQPLLDS